MRIGRGRRFLFLQGPHGPFFGRLAARLRATGAEAWRIGFNAGDRAFWPDRRSFIACHETGDAWPAFFAREARRRGVTDLVLYGDTRPVHAAAIAVARRIGLRIHVFEEGYLRPYWITYERGGANGNSELATLDLSDIRQRGSRLTSDIAHPPALWGDMREHMFYGALYHGLVMAGARRWPRYRSHREVPIHAEFALHLKRLLLAPVHRLQRGVATARITHGAFPYHLVLLQLDHDESFRAHSPFRSTAEFVDEVARGFAEGAPAHHHLVFKAHPLEDGRVPVGRAVAAAARRHGIGARVHFVPGGKLARLLDHARSAVTVNSTAGQQVLWRGKPLLAFGKSVYDKPELVSHQPVAEFFAAPRPPDIEAYHEYRSFLLATSQIPGGFYSRRGRRRLLRVIVDRMIAVDAPCTRRIEGAVSGRAHLRVVAGTRSEAAGVARQKSLT